jgi:CRP-like cAMP-binding protein
MKQDKIIKLFDALRSYMQKHTDLKDEEFELVSSLFTPVTFKRNDFLLREGEVCRYGYFVVKGTLRLYSIDKKGEEHIIQFALEDWWISDVSSMISGKASIYNIDALEDSDVLQIDKNSFEKFISFSPKFEKMFNLGSQKSRIALQERVTNFLSMSAEEKYLFMINKYPDIINRVPQRHIASFLGITPESLSRVRKNISKNRS